MKKLIVFSIEKSGFITSRSGMVVAKSKRFFSAFFSFLFSSLQCQCNITAAAAGCWKLNAFQEAAREERRTARDGRRRRPTSSPRRARSQPPPRKVKWNVQQSLSPGLKIILAGASIKKIDVDWIYSPAR